MGQFFPLCETLKGVLRAVESRVPLFFAHLRGIKGYLLMRLSIKNFSIGGA